MKRLVCLLIILCLAAAGIFAGGKKEQAVEEGKKAIRFMTTETEPESVDVDNYIIKSFQEKYPDTMVFPEYITMEDAYEKAMLMISANINPDLYYTSPQEMADAYALGVLETLDDVVKRIGDDFDPTLMKTCQVGGKTYAVPTQSGCYLYWYRKDLAAKAGISKPTTYEEIADMIPKMHNPPEIYGYTGIGAVHPNQQTPFYVMTWNYGGYIFNKEGTAALFHTKYRDNSVKIANFLNHCVEYAPPGFIGTGYTEAGADYHTGRAASLFLSTRLPSWIMASNPDMLEKTDAVPVPATKGNQVYLWGGVNIWILFKNSKYVDRAKDFIVHYMTGDRYAKFLLAVPLHLLPVRPKFIDNEDYMSHPIIKNFKGTLEMLMKSLGYFRAPSTEYGEPLVKAGACYGGKSMSKYMNMMYAGKLSVDEFIDQSGAEYDRILKQ
jgi:ABC-type glycerol-3-phosphate transport system substrate-binding protein